MSQEINIRKAEHNLQVIKEMIRWGDLFLSKQKETARELHINLVENRRNLREIIRAHDLNPAVAAFGESQAGKSYMISSLLSGKDGELAISNGLQGEDEVHYNFLKEMDPQGKGAEATAVVCRFTTRAVYRPASIPQEYAFKVNLLSVKDILLVLLDSFYNDVIISISEEENPFPSKSELEARATEITQQYKHQPVIQSNFTEDDMYAVRDYFIGSKARERYLKENTKFKACGEYLDGKYEAQATTYVYSYFFETVGTIIERIPVADLPALFSFLWLDTPVFTTTFKQLITQLGKLDYASSVYIKADALLREKGTILSVQRINELYDANIKVRDTLPDYVSEMDVFANGKEIHDINKGYFCALTMEVIVSLPANLNEEKPFLKHLDLLDFPGARSRERIPLQEGIPDKEMGQLLRRGKVAYLFNDFSANYKISNLIFCHHNKQSNVKTLEALVGGWVNNYVGATPHERSKLLSGMGIEPLFIVSTMFNLDMKRQDTADHRGTFNTRFNILNEIFPPSERSTWFRSWKEPNIGFKNSYLLRSYNYSAIDRIFTGYYTNDDPVAGTPILNECGEPRGEQAYGEHYEQYLKEMGQVFVEFDYVKKHFSDPQRAWKEVASIGKDGSAYIIEGLGIAARDAYAARTNKFRELLDTLEQLLRKHLVEKFHDDNADSALRNAVSTAGMIQMQLDLLHDRDRHFFSQFISKMMIAESDVYDILLEVINHPDILEKTDTSAYFTIRSNAGIDPQAEREVNLERIRSYYHQESVAAVEQLLADKGVDIDKLLSANLTQNVASILTERITEVWTERFLSPERFTEFIGRGLSEQELGSLLSNTKNLFLKKLRMPLYIVSYIGKYVTNNATLDALAEMLADICSEIINRFVRDMGYSYYNEDTKRSLSEAKKQLNLDIYTEAEAYELEVDTEDREEISKVFELINHTEELFNEQPANPQKLRYIPSVAGYRRWTELMKMSFVAACDIPTYDVQANNELRPIIELFQSPVTA